MREIPELIEALREAASILDGVASEVNVVALSGHGQTGTVAVSKLVKSLRSEAAEMERHYRIQQTTVPTIGGTGPTGGNS